MFCRVILNSIEHKAKMISRHIDETDINNAISDNLPFNSQWEMLLFKSLTVLLLRKIKRRTLTSTVDTELSSYYFKVA
jgi:hypothetical protein